ncbi:MAG TPA: 4-alpha-glucanotransferase [Bacteroidales bacterium]|nr:4-alpha-glucanotransferase [Bacteroidales bacterium]
MNFKRQSGILLHPTSLPGDHGIGTIGKEAFDFIDFLSVSGQKLWQILPLGPTGFGESPYQCFSSIAGNPLLISLERLEAEGLLGASDIADHTGKYARHVDFKRIRKEKTLLLNKAFRSFKKYINDHNDFNTFCSLNSAWLDDFSLYLALKEEFRYKAWNAWPKAVKFRDSETLEMYSEKLKDKILYHKFVQYTFFKQWKELKNYARKKNISIVGDIPLYVAYDSVDAWTKPENFLFDTEGRPVQVSGVPPDYFSATGQLWGNPVYNWEYLEKDGFSWWIERIKACLELYDIIRIDHFRGLSAFWSIPYGEKTAVNGTWVNASGKKLFKTLIHELGEIPIIAEDLGVITPDVEALRDGFGFPGMKILQFAFDAKEDNNYLPHTYTENCVVYTGTHDNNTSLGWYENASSADKKKFKEYIDGYIDEGPARAMIRLAWASVANIAIVPLQDVLELGAQARMNMPGTLSKNWIWKYRPGDLTAKHAVWLKNLTETYGR